jgi:hypothetical protein
MKYEVKMPYHKRPSRYSDAPQAAHGNDLVGSLPSGYSGLLKLENITLANNTFNGLMPSLTSPVLTFFIEFDENFNEYLYVYSTGYCILAGAFGGKKIVGVKFSKDVRCRVIAWRFPKHDILTVRYR